jgi:hypothetical protein
MDQSDKPKLEQGETRSTKNGRDKDVVCRRFYSTCTANILPWKLLEALETSEQEDKYFAQ